MEACSGAHHCDVTHLKDARHFASWFSITPREHSSGGTRSLGSISERGDRYLRMLLTHDQERAASGQAADAA
ncbi:MAG: transposase [Burkholderiaceae bacterium]